MDDLQKAVKLAAKLREESYDKRAADKAEATGKPAYLVNFEKFYKLSLYEAADQAASECGLDTRGTTPIYLLIKYHWNIILKWTGKSSCDAEGRK